MIPNTITCGDALTVLRTWPDECVDCVVTSPPYFGLRDYGVAGQMGLEKTPQEYIASMVGLFEEVRRVLKNTGTAWVNIGDSYAGGGKGGNPPDSPHQKQKTNRGSLLHAGLHESARVSGVIDRSWQKPPPGFKAKDLMGIPWRLAFGLQDAGWYLRSDIIWHKPNPMPESVTDRPTKAHEYLFLLAKSEQYYYDAKAIEEDAVTDDLRRPYGSKGAWDLDGRPVEQRHGGKPRESKKRGEFNGKTNAMPGREAFRAITETRNKRTVWTVPLTPFKGAHFATFPQALITPCIMAGCPVGGVVLDPFMGAGTTALVAAKLGRRWCGTELNPTYIKLAMERLGLFGLPVVEASA